MMMTSTRDWISGAQVFANEASSSLLYKKTLLIIPDLWQFWHRDPSQLYEFHRRFGSPWPRSDYEFCRENTSLLPDLDISVYKDGGYQALSGTVHHELPWHSDVPIYAERHLNWPIRSLTATVLPENAPTTSFSSMFALYDALSADEKAFAEQVTLTYQSWHYPGTCWTDMPLVQAHPVTGRKFLALNSYNPGKLSTFNTRHWIQRASIAGDTVERSGKEVLGRYDDMIEDLAYRHHWRQGEMIVFDNTGMLHRRDGHVDTNHPRVFYRVNVRHAWQAERLREQAGSGVESALVTL